jgi:molybdopterin synthase catalytic subunit/molybdopterin converting factor small subunit
VRLTVRLFASLRERAGCESLVLENVPSGSDVAAAKRLLEARRPELGPLQAVRGVPGRAVPDATRLSEGRSRAPSAGLGRLGRNEDAAPRAAFELGGTLDVAASSRVSTSCGAVVVQRQRARANRSTTWCARLRGLPEDGRERDGARLRNAAASPATTAPRAAHAVLHRTGEVAVGEPAVVVAVASPHRDDAFQAARFLIDELKARVPLWKKEVYADGHHWIGERP